MKSFDLISVCPFCQYGFDLASSVKGGQKAPSDGDLTICIRCGEFAVFDKKEPGGLRKPTDAEYVTIGHDTFCQRMRAAWVKSKPKIEAAMAAKETPFYETLPIHQERNAKSKSPMGDMTIEQGFEALLASRYLDKQPPPDIRELLREWYFLGACKIMDRMHHVATMGEDEANTLMNSMQAECNEFAKSMLAKMKKGGRDNERTKH